MTGKSTPLCSVTKTEVSTDWMTVDDVIVLVETHAPIGRKCCVPVGLWTEPLSQSIPETTNTFSLRDDTKRKNHLKLHSRNT